MQVTDEMARVAADAMEAAEFGYQLTLTSLVDGEHTYTLTYSDEPEPLTFSDINDGYTHIAARKRDKQARAALTAALAAMWRPIEEAPRDGRYFAVARFKQDELRWLKHSRWMTAAEAAENEGGAEEDFEPGWTDGEDEDDYCYPTHFADILTPPLPSPPKAEG